MPPYRLLAGARSCDLYTVCSEDWFFSGAEDRSVTGRQAKRLNAPSSIHLKLAFNVIKSDINVYFCRKMILI
jgi:hypothetical protein